MFSFYFDFEFSFTLSFDPALLKLGAVIDIGSLSSYDEALLNLDPCPPRISSFFWRTDLSSGNLSCLLFIKSELLPFLLRLGLRVFFY